MRTGIATVPLDYGKCPYWLFDRMKRLSRGVALAIVEEFGAEELLRRFSDPGWFQSFGCVLGFDWNSSGLTTTTMGAFKEGLRGIENDLGIFVCGGKGRTSRKTPEQIQDWGEFLGFSPEKIDKIVYASKMSAKVDNNALQDGFQIYHHNLIFTKSGKWTVVQQGMSEQLSQARRYHWAGENVKNFTEEPHSGIASDIKVRPLNLTAKESNSNKEISVSLSREEPNKFLKDFKKIVEKPDGLIRRKKVDNFTDIELNNAEFHWHPVVNEKFDLKRLEKTIFAIHSENPENFEHLLSLKGVGPKTIRALSLVAEIIYGAKPSYEDPARYTFAHGGKDGTPYFVEKETYDKTIKTIEYGIKKSRIDQKEKEGALRRLVSTIEK